VISGFAERAILLAIVAVVALVAVLYPKRPKHHAAPKLPVQAGVWHDAVAGAHGGAAPGKRSRCGQVVRKDELGVAYAGLPCGAKIFVAYGKTVVLTEVVDQGPYVPGRAFDFTPALARKLGLTGTQHVRWRFARAP
jgi:rare lipoprotein A (peptidoglycan hydrolase)